MWPFNKTETGNKQLEAKPSLLTKLKGAGKLSFGVFCLLNPHVAFGLGLVACGVVVAGKVASNITGRPLKTMYNDLFDGTFARNAANMAGMGFGAFVGLYAPYVGMGLAAAGGIAYLASNPTGLEGLFQGGAIATAIGTVGIPAVGVAMCVDGIANALGYETGIVAWSLERSKNLFKSMTKTIEVAEQNPNQPNKAVTHVASEITQGAIDRAKDTLHLANATKDMRNKVKENLGEENVSALTKPFKFLGSILESTKPHAEKSKVEKLTEERNSPKQNSHEKK